MIFNLSSGILNKAQPLVLCIIFVILKLWIVIIKRQKPKLAICVYHKPEDIWEIPEFLLNIRPDYKFYFRHYCYWDIGETVMYAV